MFIPLRPQCVQLLLATSSRNFSIMDVQQLCSNMDLNLRGIFAAQCWIYAQTTEVVQKADSSKVRLMKRLLHTSIFIYLRVTAVEWFTHSVSLPGSVHITLGLLDPVFFFSSSTLIKHTSGTQREHRLLCCFKWIQKWEDAPVPSQTDQRSITINQIF